VNGIPYFKHDSNASRDPKLQMLKGAIGSDAALRRYFTLLELLSEQDGCLLPVKYAVGVCASQWECNQAEAQQTLDIMIDLELVTMACGYYYSHGLLLRAYPVYESRAHACKGEKKTQALALAQAFAVADVQAIVAALVQTPERTPVQTPVQAGVQASRVEQSITRAEQTKVNESISSAPVFQDEVRVFLEAYPPTLKRQENAVWKAYQVARQRVSAEDILEGARHYAQHIADTETTPQYTKSAVRWLEEEGWTAEYEKPAEPSFHGNYLGAGVEDAGS